MPLADLLSLILMGAASILCAALVFFLMKITRSVMILTENITTLKTEIIPVLKNITQVTEKINSAADEIRQPLNDVLNIVYEIREKINFIFSYEENIRTNISSSFSGVLNGIRTFWNSYSHNGKNTLMEYHEKI